MGSVISAIEDIIAGIFNFVQALISTILSTISGTASVAGSTVKGGTHATGNIIDFLLSKFGQDQIHVAHANVYSSLRQHYSHRSGYCCIGWLLGLSAESWTSSKWEDDGKEDHLKARVLAREREIRDWEHGMVSGLV